LGKHENHVGGPLFVGHDIYRATGYNRQHPLAIARVGPVIDICRALGWLHPDNYRESPMATLEELAAFHAPAYLAALAEASRSGAVTAELRSRYRLGTMENPVFPGLFERAARSVGGSVLAARLALPGRVVFHPAGGTHHGRPDRASGFCYFNDPVFALRAFLDEGLRRIAYVDFDAHHGDGVEDAFAGDARVLCVSVHEEGRWPGTGTAHTATARNYPVRRGFDDAGFRTLMAEHLLPAIRGFAPEAAVITCGADGLAGDPLSSLQLSNVALWDAVADIVAEAPRAVVLGGGGYNPWTTVRCWAGLWGRLNGFAIPSALPAAVTAILRGFTCDLIDDEDMNPAWLSSLADAP
jgi:acetoin utilization protein AcuC